DLCGPDRAVLFELQVDEAAALFGIADLPAADVAGGLALRHQHRVAHLALLIELRLHGADELQLRVRTADDERAIDLAGGSEHRSADRESQQTQADQRASSHVSLSSLDGTAFLPKSALLTEDASPCATHFNTHG